jgi:hypothetical protein
MYNYKQVKIGKHKILLLLLLLLLHVCLFKYASCETQLNLKVWPVRKKCVFHIMTMFVNFPQVSPFISLCDLFYLLTVGVEGYCCTWSHCMTHTHTHTHTLYDSSRRETGVSQRPVPPQHTTFTRETQPRPPPTGIRTRYPSKQAVANLPLIPHDLNYPARK